MAGLHSRAYATRKHQLKGTWQSQNNTFEEDTLVKAPKGNLGKTIKNAFLRAFCIKPHVQPSASMGQEYSHLVRDNQTQDHIIDLEDHIIDLEDQEEMEDVQLTPRAPFIMPIPSNSRWGFFDLLEQDRNAILEMVLRRQASFEPYYNRYNLELCDIDEEVLDANGNLVLRNKMEVSNIDVPLFTVSKQMYREASAIFYGVNTFDIANPTIGMWWLKKIGSNVVKIRNLHLILKGFEHDPFNTREEKLWLYFLSDYIRTQCLRTITIDFSDWQAMDFSVKWDQGRVCKTRKLCVDTFALFRGLKSVRIIKGEFISTYDANKLKQLMMMPRDMETSPFDFRVGENAIQGERFHDMESNSGAQAQSDRMKKRQRVV